MHPTFTTALNSLMVASLACGAVSWLVFFYANARVFAATGWLLHLLEEVAPDVHQRLRDPFWRTGVAPWDLKAFLYSDELDDVGAIKRAKKSCRFAERLLRRAMYAWLAFTCCCLAAGALAKIMDVRVR